MRTWKGGDKKLSLKRSEGFNPCNTASRLQSPNLYRCTSPKLGPSGRLTQLVLGSHYGQPKFKSGWLRDGHADAQSSTKCADAQCPKSSPFSFLTFQEGDRPRVKCSCSNTSGGCAKSAKLVA